MPGELMGEAIRGAQSNKGGNQRRPAPGEPRDTIKGFQSHRQAEGLQRTPFFSSERPVMNCFDMPLIASSACASCSLLVRSSASTYSDRLARALVLKLLGAARAGLGGLRRVRQRRLRRRLGRRCRRRHNSTRVLHLRLLARPVTRRHLVRQRRSRAGAACRPRRTCDPSAGSLRRRRRRRRAGRGWAPSLQGGHGRAAALEAARRARAAPGTLIAVVATCVACKCSPQHAPRLAAPDERGVDRAL
jgi:hypothetical protein